MANTLAIMMTMTTYGTWLRGDARGWVDKGVVFPPDPDLEATDCARLKHSIYRFADADWYRVGSMMGSIRCDIGNTGPDNPVPRAWIGRGLYTRIDACQCVL